MKRRLLLILGGFAIGCVLTIFAQQTDSADPRIGQQRDLLGVPQALDEFGDINRLWTTHTIGTMQQQRPLFSPRTQFCWRRMACSAAGST